MPLHKSGSASIQILIAVSVFLKLIFCFSKILIVFTIMSAKKPPIEERMALSIYNSLQVLTKGNKTTVEFQKILTKVKNYSLPLESYNNTFFFSTDDVYKSQHSSLYPCISFPIYSF